LELDFLKANIGHFGESLYTPIAYQEIKLGLFRFKQSRLENIIDREFHKKLPFENIRDLKSRK